MLRRSLLRVWFFIAVTTAFAAGSNGLAEHFIKVHGLKRRYLQHQPPNRTKPAKAPVIIVLHGGGGRPESSVTLGLDEYADPKGFIVVYPEGIKRGWNDGRPIPGRTADDVGFISALIDELVKKDNADAKRIYVTGISNGGFMSFTLACRIAGKIAAIAPVAASMGVGAIEKCHPQRGLPIMMINGTADPLVKFEGGKVMREGSDAEPVRKVLEFWRTQACGGAKAAPKSERLPDADPEDGSTVEVERVECAGGEMVNYTVKGGGHTWPGGKQYLPKFVVGSVNQDFSASAAIVEFFGRQ